MIDKLSNQERATWSYTTKTYVEALEEDRRALRRQLWEAKVMNEIKDCPWCDKAPVMTELPVSHKFMLSCANKDCEVQPHTSQQTKLKAIQAWNRRNRSLELTADYCDYYEKELIPQLKATETKHLRLAGLIKDYFDINEIGCECCTVCDCGQCYVCCISKYFIGEKDVTKQD